MGIIKNPYQNLMLDKRVLRTEERPIRPKSFLSQKVVQHEVWTSGFQKRHNFREQSPWKEMQPNSHPNEYKLLYTVTRS